MGYFLTDDKDCERWISSKGTLDVTTQEYGAWLRAPLFNNAKKNVITVAGYEEGSSSSWPSTAAEGGNGGKAMVGRGATNQSPIRMN